MEIVKPSWVENEYLGVKKMLDETVNQKSKDKTPVPNMASMVLRAILEDSRYPESLYTDTLIRIRAEQGNVTYGRAAIIKAFLIKNRGWKEGDDSMTKIDIISEKNNMFRTLFAGCIMLLIIKLCLVFNFVESIRKNFDLDVLIVVILTIICAYSYRKQAKYVAQRVRNANKNN